MADISQSDPLMFSLKKKYTTLKNVHTNFPAGSIRISRDDLKS